MNKKINFSQVPSYYKMCLNQECVNAGTCLRQLAEQSVPPNIECLTIISPKYLATQKGECPHYRPNNKVYFAKGFIRILENLPYKQMRIVISCLITHFNRRNYYRIRKGERLLSPTAQQEFLNILKSCNVSDPGEFDAYLEEYDW